MSNRPPPTVLVPGTYPIIGLELAAYGVVQHLARKLGFAILGTLGDRVGDTYEPDGCAVVPAVSHSKVGAGVCSLTALLAPQSEPSII